MPNTYVIVHYPTAYTKPVGIWWWNDIQNCPNSFYMPGTEKYKNSVMDLLGSARDSSHWELFTQKLADATPVADSFQADNIDVSPKIYLKSLRSH